MFPEWQLHGHQQCCLNWDRNYRIMSDEYEPEGKQ